MKDGFQVEVPNRVRKEMRDLPDEILLRILSELITLQSNPLPLGTKKLQNRSEYRIRVGDYRILYEINFKDKMIEIVAVLHRRSAYQ